MSLNDMLAKNSPIGDKRKTSESEYLRLLGRNTELVDKIKWLERDKKELQERIDRTIELLESKKHCEKLFGGVEEKTFTEQAIEILKGGDK